MDISVTTVLRLANRAHVKAVREGRDPSEAVAVAVKDFLLRELARAVIMSAVSMEDIKDAKRNTVRG